MNYQYILFDLDGTLTDPGMGITNALMHALEKYGIKVEDRETLYPFIGPPLTESFENFYGFSKEEAKQAVEYYRDYYREKGLFENKVYEGIPALLEKLVSREKTLLVATSKPEIFANQILKHFGIHHYFSFVAGSHFDGSRVQKNEVIEYVLERAGVKDLSTAVMIGDRKHDMIGAKKVGLDSIGVLYGYGDREELEKAGATMIVRKVEELETMLR